jgi:hypothetical protein
VIYNPININSSMAKWHGIEKTKKNMVEENPKLKDKFLKYNM